MLAMLSHAKLGIGKLIDEQKKILDPVLSKVDEMARERLKSRFR